MSRLAICAAVCAALAGCGNGGDEEEGRAVGMGPDRTQSGGTSPTTPGATPSVPEPTTPAAPTTTGQPRTDEGGDEEPIRIPATFTLRAGRLRPATVSVPAFLAIEVSVRNLDRVTRVVTVRADRPYRLTVGPRGRVARLVPGQRPGNYPVIVAGGGRAILHSGGEPGP